MRLSPNSRRAAIVLGAILGTAALLAVAFVLGAWAYHYRRYSLHESRLQRLNAKHPSAAQVTDELARDGATPFATPRSVAELEKLLPYWPSNKSQQILSKHTESAETRIFLVGDMVYFVYFGPDGVMRDFVCISN